jgi:hypothetical protein
MVEGVDGSSPSEGFEIKYLQMAVVLPALACDYGLAGTKRVHIRGLAGTRGHGRRLASHRDTRPSSDDVRAPEDPCIRAAAVALLGETVTTSLQRGHRMIGYVEFGFLSIAKRADYRCSTNAVAWAGRDRRAESADRT